jgi:hypothetical protein
MSITSPAPRYERVASLIFVVLIGLAVVFVIDGNPNTLRIVLGGDLPTIPISWLLVASLVFITSAGADLLARMHPQMQTRSLPVINLGFSRFEVAPGFWILPSFSVIGSFAFFRLFSEQLQGTAFALALVAAGGSLTAILFAQHYALDRNPLIARRAQMTLHLFAYVLAFGCFSAIYYGRLRTLYSASLVGLTSTLLAYEILQWTERPGMFRLALLTGLLLGEATWPLNYLATTFLLGGTTLLVIFYCVIGLLQHHVVNKLQPRLIIEYLLLGSGLLAAVIYATFA